MIANMHVGDTISFWDCSEDARVQIIIGQCKDPSLVSIYGVSGMENCIIITIISMVEAFEQRRLFCQALWLHNIADHWWEMIVFGL